MLGWKTRGATTGVGWAARGGWSSVEEERRVEGEETAEGLAWDGTVMRGTQVPNRPCPTLMAGLSPPRYIRPETAPPPRCGALPHFRPAPRFSPLVGSGRYRRLWQGADPATAAAIWLEMQSIEFPRFPPASGAFQEIGSAEPGLSSRLLH